MKKVIISIFSLILTFGIVQGQTVLQTEVPYHACQENVCSNTTELIITSPVVSKFSLIAPQIGTSINMETMVNVFLDTFNLNTSSSDFAWMHSMCEYRTWGWHSAWRQVETQSGAAHNPATSASSFGSMQCGEWASTGAILVNRARISIGLEPLEIRKLWMNGHTTVEYFDTQHGDWVYCDMDGAGASVAFVSDGNGFFASQAEIAENIDLILSEESIVFQADGSMSANCAREIFYTGVTEENGLFNSISYSPILDTLPDMGSTTFTIGPGVEVKFDDRTGDYFYFDTTGLTEEIMSTCTQEEIESLMYAEPDSGCASDDETPMCLIDAIGNMNGFPDLHNEMIPFLQSKQYHAFGTGLPAKYRPRFIRGGETMQVILQPGEYSDSVFQINLVLHRIIPQNSGIDFQINNKTYNEEYTITKYMNSRDDDVDSTFNYPANKVIEYGESASIPESVGNVILEFYFNYHIFPIMHASQRIVVDTGFIVTEQSFLYQEENNLLPVELLSFEGYPQNNASHLEWVTSTEVNTEKFIIEHGLDGENFTTVGEVAAQGNSTELVSYEFIHEEPSVGPNYYRLRIQDLDGYEEYSSIKTVLFDGVSGIAFAQGEKIRIYPNPTTGIFHLTQTTARDASVFNVLGERVGTIPRESILFDMSNHPKGVYFIPGIGKLVKK